MMALRAARVDVLCREPSEPQPDLAAVVGAGRWQDVRVGDPAVDDLGEF